MAEALAEMGATVAVVDLNGEAVEKVVSALQARDLKAIGKVGDMIEEASVRDRI